MISCNGSTPWNSAEAFRSVKTELGKVLNQFCLPNYTNHVVKVSLACGSDFELVLQLRSGFALPEINFWAQAVLRRFRELGNHSEHWETHKMWKLVTCRCCFGTVSLLISVLDRFPSLIMSYRDLAALWSCSKCYEMHSKPQNQSWLKGVPQ